MASSGAAASGALALPASARLLLCSDMHLGAHDVRTAEWFFGALEPALAHASHLALLGDLFEAWTGDDDPDPVAREFVDRLTRIARAMPVYLMHGNRDFLIGDPLPGTDSAGFVEATGAQLLPDPTVLTLGSCVALLTHGDALCTDDHAYQAARAERDRPAWRSGFLARPSAERQAMARALRARSELEKTQKDAALMDVNPQAVEAALRAHRVATMIHGHTHRPARHDWVLDGSPAQRWVLPDWDALTGRGGFLLVEANGIAAVDAGGEPATPPSGSGA